MAPIVKTSIIGTIAAILVAMIVTTALSEGSVMAYGVSVFALCAALAFTIQWLAFVPAYIFQTEHFYDLCGGLTYLALLGFAITHVAQLDERSLMIACLCGVWAIRLSSFLFLRVQAAGFDRRFNKMKTIPMQFFMTWTLQGLWVTVTLSAALTAITSVYKTPIGIFFYIGLALWVLGFVIEVVADRQKTAFRAQNSEGFITTGLWAWSRHPNYFGEIMLWTGICVMAAPTFAGWQWVALISPIFVYVLLVNISGVRMLEVSGQKRWGDDPLYQEYLAKTPSLMMKPPAN